MSISSACFSPLNQLRLPGSEASGFSLAVLGAEETFSGTSTGAGCMLRVGVKGLNRCHMSCESSALCAVHACQADVCIAFVCPHNAIVLGCLGLSFVLLCRRHDRVNTSPGRLNLVARGPSPRRSHAITTAALRRLVKSGAKLCSCMPESPRTHLGTKLDPSVGTNWGTPPFFSNQVSATRE